MGGSSATVVRRRQIGHGFCLALGLGLLFVPNFEWQGAERFHTTVEAVAASVALLIGALSLLHHHAKKSNRLLFVGAAFLGAGLLDGYHAVVTSAWWESVWPVSSGSIRSWSWTSSRVVLAVLLMLGWWSGRREQRHGEAAQVRGAFVYLTLFAILQVLIGLLAVVPLPEAIDSNAWLARPQELIPAMLFLFVAVATLAEGRWKTDAFEHWFVLALLIAFLGEALCASFSARPLDGMAQLAHALKYASYLCVLAGVLSSVHAHIRQVRENAVALATWNVQLERRVAERTVLLEAEIAKRERAQRSLESEGRIATELARAGRELISSIESPVLLERLCQITAEVLRCDHSITLLWRPAENAFEPVASFGLTPEEREALHVVKVPREVMSVLLSRLEHDDAAEVNTVPSGVVPREQLPGVESKKYIAMALRGGREIIGVQSAGRRRAAGGFSQSQYRIARGIAQLASLSLHNSRLYEELQRALRLKSEFVATMSHELRTPLNVILGYHDLLLHGDFGALTADQAEVLQRANKSAEELFELIGGILDLSRLGREDAPLQVEEVGVGELMRDVVGAAEAGSDKEEVELVCQKVPNRLRLATDRLKLRLVLGNLVGNAVKFTDRGKVEVRAAERDGGIEFAVADTGAGIPEESLPSIFEPFQQGTESSDRYYGGIGLGLYIVRRVVDALGGDIDVESQVGRGSVFRVWIPSASNGHPPRTASASAKKFAPPRSASAEPVHAA